MQTGQPIPSQEDVFSFTVVSPTSSFVLESSQVISLDSDSSTGPVLHNNVSFVRRNLASSETLLFISEHRLCTAKSQHLIPVSPTQMGDLRHCFLERHADINVFQPWL